MANIDAKAYNEAQRIAFAEFNGSPNLFPTVDLNRQIAILQAQLDELSNLAGVRHNLKLDCAVVTSSLTRDYTIKVNPAVSGETMSVWCRGCRFDFGTSEITLQAQLNKSDIGIVYLGFTLTKSKVTFNDDPTHLISGVTFGGSNATAAADHYVYGTPSLALSKNPSSFSIVLAKIQGNANIDIDITWNGSRTHASTQLLAQTPGFNLGITAPPVCSVIPYYGDVTADVMPYGWIPCSPLGAYTAGTTPQLITNYETLYGSGNITFTQITMGSTQQWAIQTVKGQSGRNYTIPFIGKRVLLGTGPATTDNGTFAAVSKGSTAGEANHILTLAETATGTYIRKQQSVGFYQTGVSGLTDQQTQRDHYQNTTQGHNNLPPYFGVSYLMRIG